jgi:yecA family protein
MTRYEAHIEKGWEEAGLAHLLVTRVREDGYADIGSFLIDLHCLGVKDAAFAPDFPGSELEEFVKDRLPAELRERIHPACAKKLIEGALEYAQSLGFAPHRDYRKARKVLSGIDALLCPREFTYGRDGRPCYSRGPDDTDERVDRILQILEARCGADGFDYVGLEEADGGDPRTELIEWLDTEPPEVPRFFELSGLVTAMLVCPGALSPLKVLDVLWGPQGREWSGESDVQEFCAMLMNYWNHVNDLFHDAMEPGAPPNGRVIDIWDDDFPPDDDESGIPMTIAMCAWAIGFRRATALWPDAWGDALTRPDLAPHWEVIGWWADFHEAENRDLVVENAESGTPRTINASVLALAHALRPSPRRD